MNQGTSSGDVRAASLPSERRLLKHSLLTELAGNSVISIAAFFAVVCVVFSLGTDAFLTSANLLNVVRQAAPLLIVSAAMTFVITTGGIDLAVGSVVAITATLSAVFLQWGLPWPLAVLALLGIGAAIGALQGFFVAFERIPAFIVTLAGLSVIRGIALLITGGYSIPIDPESSFNLIGRGQIGPIPAPVVIACLFIVLANVVYGATTFGRYVTGVGANAEAVRRAGVNTRLVLLKVYILSATAAALAGIVIAARLGSGSANSGQGFELDVIAAVVLGGTSLFGGRGSIIGTLLGALTVSVIANGLILAHLSPFLTPIVTGTIILVAIWLNFRLFPAATRTR
ncbi:ABC transporter permease [Oryzibacter oryziterrae]|uniref:ABC transporter permease n=1 Tax=Oryzibacter oryziterrae TaxID=2766474 RepID=UPI001F2D6378|nr:ABC transporter permease [Oryzibacter oryziterrae]